MSGMHVFIGLMILAQIARCYLKNHCIRNTLLQDKWKKSDQTIIEQSLIKKSRGFLNFDVLSLTYILLLRAKNLISCHTNLYPLRIAPSSYMFFNRTYQGITVYWLGNELVWLYLRHYGCNFVCHVKCGYKYYPNIGIEIFKSGI